MANQFFSLDDGFSVRLKSLEEALWLVEARVDSWANHEPFDPLLGWQWSRGSRNSVDTLVAEEVNSAAIERPGNSGLLSSLEIVNAATLNGAKSAYFAPSADQGERIALNFDWLQQVGTTEIETVLLANVGHVLRQRLGAQPSPAKLDAINSPGHLSGCGCRACSMPDPFAPQSTKAKLGSTASSALIGPLAPLAAPAAAASLQVLADYLQSGYWTSNGTIPRRYNLGSTGNNPNNGILYYNVSGWSSDADGLSAERKALVREVFKLYQAVLGINFQETASTGGEVDFFFRDNASGAYATPAGTSYGNGVDWSEINIAASWYGASSQYVGYTLQTVLHEVGHSLGLGHQGNYNGTVDYATQAVYANDSWFESMMSYLPQNASPYFSAYNPVTAAAGISYSWLETPMSVDWLALDAIYGTQGYGVNRAFQGDTVYGVNTSITSAVSDVWNKFSVNAGSTAYTLIDGSGYDRLDVSNFASAQLINLAPSLAGSTAPSSSDIGGKVGNLTIAVGTIIEAATGGSGADQFYGNDVANTFIGNDGNDVFYDSLGSDIYYGGAGLDSLYFAGSIDLFTIAYDPTVSFLSIGKSASADVELVYNDVETISFNGSAYAFSALLDNVSPALLGSTPSNGAQAVAAGSNIILNFSENVKAGTGFIVISNGEDILSIDVADSGQVVFSGASVTINPAVGLVGGTLYSLQLAAGVIRDISGNSFAGIASATELNFSTLPLPQLSIVSSDTLKAEGNNGMTAYTFTVTRSGDSSGSSTATWVVSGTGSQAADGLDFMAGSFPSGSVSFLAGESSQMITIQVNGDSTMELDEDFTVTLANPGYATIGTASADGTIGNDDLFPPPELLIAASDAVKLEGNSGTIAYAFTVTRSGVSSGSSSATWSVSGTGSYAADALDFGGSLPSGTVVFAAGETSQQIIVYGSADSSAESDESFLVTLSAPIGAIISGSSASGQILNDDIIAPAVIEVSTGLNDANLAIGESVIFTVLFSDVVFVTGSPALQLANGGIAIYASGSGTSSLDFAYVVAAANANTSDLSTASTNAIALAGASIANILGTPADLIGANAVNPVGILAVDVAPAAVTSMAVSGNTVILAFQESVKGTSLIASNFSRQIGAAAPVAATGISLDSTNNTVTLSFGTVSTTNPAPGSTSAVRVSYAATSGNAVAGLITDQAGNPLSMFSNKVVDTFQSAATVAVLGDSGTTTPATSYSNLLLTGASAINGTGNALANTITGNIAVNVLDGKAGVDVMDGLGSGDIYVVANASDHAAAEFMDSGLSGVDEARFSSGTSGQTLILFAGDTGLERAVIGTGTATAAVSTGTVALNIDASALLNGLSITGNAGVNTLSGTAFADSLNGNAGLDTILGLAGADAITGGAGLDVLSGGEGSDSFAYTTLADGGVGGTSAARIFEKITDFQVGLDRIDAPGTAVRTVKVLGAVSALTDTAIGALLNGRSLGSVNFAASGASSFSFGTGLGLRTFLAINNNVASYSATADAIVEITNYGFATGFSTLASINVA